MEILAEQIKRELAIETWKSGHCAIYEEELQRLWPLEDENRERKIAQFARDYGLRLTFYKQGLGAIFVREPPSISM